MVQDNGIGFPEKYNETIFNVFTRLNSRDKYTGSGVGTGTLQEDYAKS